MKPEERTVPKDVARCTLCGEPFMKPTRFFLPGRLPVCVGCFTPDTRAAARRPSKHDTPPHTGHV